MKNVAMNSTLVWDERTKYLTHCVHNMERFIPLQEESTTWAVFENSCEQMAERRKKTEAHFTSDDKM